MPVSEKINPLKNFYPALFLLVPLLIFFLPVLLHGKMPIPADTIVGLYHPFRDITWKGMNAGVPFKNFLITDAVRQQYPWRKLAIETLKRGEYPGWNPYTFAGMPLAANLQTAVFYPLNFLFFLLPFDFAWTVQVILQLVLLSLFSYVYLREIGRSKQSAILFSLVLCLGGFSIAWLEWNTTLHTFVWLPASLLTLEKIAKSGSKKWYLLLWFSLICIFFAGFLQTAFYSYLVIFGYACFKLIALPENRRQILFNLTVTAFFVLLLTSVQWLPAFRLITESSRAYDQGDVLSRQDWFLPFQNLLQFIAPDFFGNPATLNYWGVFNYTEFIGYIGMFPLIFSIFSMAYISTFGRKEKFFLALFSFSLIFATPNLVAKIPYALNLPFISSAQPSRLMMLIFFSLALLGSAGFDCYLIQLQKKELSKGSLKKMLLALISVFALLAVMFISVHNLPGLSRENILVSERNLIFPSLLFSASVLVLLFPLLAVRGFHKLYNFNLKNSVFILIFLITVFDLLRFANKFTPFSDRDFLYPETETLRFLQSDREPFRYMTVDRRIFPPNFSLVYKLQTIEGYDPIFLKRYGQLIASAQKGEPVLAPVAFQRIISPDNYQSSVYDVLNVKYVLSLTEITDPKLVEVFREGETRVYQNLDVFPRVFLIPDYQQPKDDTEALQKIINLKKSEIKEEAQISEYSENEVKINVESLEGGMLILCDNYFPGWEVFIDGQPALVERVLYNLRGTIVTPGKHEVFYRYSQL